MVFSLEILVTVYLYGHLAAELVHYVKQTHVLPREQNSLTFKDDEVTGF